MNVYSQAFNFGSYLDGSVDPRTGQYNVRINLMTLCPMGPLEVSRDVALSFSMFSTDSSVYGPGWQLSKTEFDSARLRLTLLSGEQFKAQSMPVVGGTMVFKDRKLKDLVVRRPDANTLHVVYKDGTVEVLQRTDSSMPYRIVAIEFENGERIRWEYTLRGSLERVLGHDQQVLLLLTYSEGYLATVDSRVDGGRYARTRFTYSNGRLTAVTAPYDRDGAVQNARYVFGYTSAFSNGLIGIDHVKTPMGGEEFIRYVERGHQYGNGQYLPRVFSWVQIPASSQLPITRTYTYSTGNNFTGFPYSGGFREGEDNLYLIGGDYSYWTEEECIDPQNDTVLSSVRTTYNRFHLLIEERSQREGTLAKTNITYNIKPGLFAQQPANLQLPKTLTKRYELLAGGTSREEIQDIETDDYGNELSRTEASGVRTEYSYYPITGESGKCPADPHGLFQRYVKQKRLMPAQDAPAPRLIEYTHTRVPATGSSYVVVQDTSTQSGVSSMQQTYFDSPVELIGRVKSTISTIDGLSSVGNFSYVVSGENLIETRRLQGREGQWLESRRTLSLVNRRLLSMARDGDSTLTLAFDVSGRLTAETVSPGEPQQAARHYAYHFATQTERAHLITTDAQGNRAITYYDGLGRQVYEAQLMSDGQERATGTWLYDAQGRTVEVVKIDYLTDGPRSLKDTHTYSRWGNASRVSRADGSVVIDEYDPHLNMKTEGIEGGERLRTYFNDHHQPIRVERLDTADNSVEVESRTYDGLGRCLSMRDISNNFTEFTYDAFDRLITTHQKPTDGTAQRLRTSGYAPGSSSDLVRALTIDGKQLGARTYDSLGRMTSQVRGTGHAMTWEYEAGWMEPVAQVSPRGVREELFYDKELDTPSRVEIAGRPVNTYRHDLISGALTRSVSGSQTDGLIHEIIYDVNGYPNKDVQTVDGTSVTTLYDYSPGGRVQCQTAADGQRSQFDYDARGRFLRMTTGSMVIEQHYDILGRPQTLTAVYESTRVVTRLTYDLLGREAERRFEQNGALLQVMTSTYHPNSMLAARVLRDANAQLVIGETFIYDAYLRLKTYRCEGREHPQDRLGRSIVEQDFSFDSLNNITQVVTSFADGTQDTCERFFTGTDPTQLTRLTHTHPVQDRILAYDASGNLQTGPSGNVYTYNAFEQLTKVEVGALTYGYQYDAESRQVLASRDSEPPVMLAYSGDRLDTLVEGGKKIRYHGDEDQVVARSGGVDGPQLHVSDASGSVRGISSSGQAHVRRHYTPYGSANIDMDDGKARTMADLQLPAFNGQRLDAATNVYSLGNGQRAYDPDLMAFLQPDPLSPFDEGGLNGYAYCMCNPINMVDPSGLWPSWLKWLFTGASLVLGLVTLGSGLIGLVTVGLAAATVSQITGVVGSVLGVIGGTLGVSALSVEAVDKANGWDRSNVIKDLGWAAFAFSLASLSASTRNAWDGASKAYGAAKTASKGGALAERSMIIDVPLRAGLRSASKSFMGRNFKFDAAKDPTTFSKAFGSTRAVIRFTNLSRALTARYKALDTPDEHPAQEGDQAHPRLQPELARVIDMSYTASNYYESFRVTATRLRQPITGELYAGVSQK